MLKHGAGTVVSTMLACRTRFDYLLAILLAIENDVHSCLLYFGYGGCDSETEGKVIIEVSKPKRGQPVTVWLTESHVAKLEGIKARTGLSTSRVMRRLIDQLEAVQPVTEEPSES
jgi:hypothetical protein